MARVASILSQSESVVQDIAVETTNNNQTEATSSSLAAPALAPAAVASVSVPSKVIQGHPLLVPIESSYDFLLVINTNVPPILHRFRDIAFDMSKTAIFDHPSCV